MSDIRELDALAARLDDLILSADKGDVCVSSFLTPRECLFAERHLRLRGAHFLLFGGYADAERKRVYILPDYMADVEDIKSFSDYGYDAQMIAIELISGGFCKISHRDYLGSVLGLGFERSVIGDIAVCDDGARAVVFCDATIGGYISENLTKVANDRVKARVVELDSVILPERKMQPINDTVASARCDCVVAAICSLSRERAKDAVEAGFVEVDYEREERPDKILTAPCTVSVRGKGKFRVLSIQDKTKKGRFRLIAEKYL